MSNVSIKASQIQLLKSQLSNKQSFSEQVYHFEKSQRQDAEKEAKIASENEVKERKSRNQIVRERIRKYTEKSQRQLFLRADKPIAKAKHDKKLKQKLEGNAALMSKK